MSPPSPRPHDDPVVDASASSSADSSRTGRDEANERTDDWTDVTETIAAGSAETAPTDQSENGRLSPDSPRESGPRRRPPQHKESDHSQSLRSKLVLALALMLGVVVGIDEIVRQKVIAPEFANLERVTALKDTNRVLSAINTEVEFLSETAPQGASRIEVHRRQANQSGPAEIRWSELPQDLHGRGERVEWSAIARRDWRWTWIREPGAVATVTGQSESGRVEFPGISERLAALDCNDTDSLQGITRGSDGELYLFAAVPLESWEGEPAEQADTEPADVSAETFYIVGRHFGESVTSDLRQRTSVLFSVRPLQKDQAFRKSIEISANDSSMLSVVWPLLSPSGKPLAELSVQLPRDVTSRSNRTTAFARYLSLCGACVSLLLLLLLLQRIVIGRLETIREHTEQIARTGIISEESTAPVLRVAGHDEIGQLAQSFDRMRVRLGDAQRRLSDASHAAGMSLVADTVIHNVGNVLTNVNSLIDTATRRVESLRIEPLEKLANRLRQDDVDEALRQATPDYLQKLSQCLEDDKDDLAGLLQTLNDNVQHIHQVIRDQRRHANQPIEWVQLDAKTVVEEAVKCSQARLANDNVVVELECDLEARIWTDRSLLLQILINIIANAGNATSDIKNRQPTLKIDLIRTKSTIHIRFRDNGCGMDEATRARVFDAHFTTRQSGSGLGLHFCALAMKRIGGSIRADSDGPDQGATFVVDLPVNKPNAETVGQCPSVEAGDTCVAAATPRQQH